MSEFAPDLIVILADAEEITSEIPLQALLPHAFGPKDIS
jgi:cytidine deaminase